MSLYMYAYNNASESATKLADELGILKINHKDTKFKGHDEHVVLNWGCSDLPREVRKCRIINEENAVACAVNKLDALLAIGNIAVPFYTQRRDAEQAIRRGCTIYCRTKLTGHDGDGLVVATRADQLVDAKLYTIGIEADREYRITVFNGAVIARQRKVRLDTRPATGYNDRVKTTAGGYGFKWVTLNIPRMVEQAAINACEEIGLHFGGVDIIWADDRAYVLEVNTAPQLTDRACEALADAVRELLGDDAD